MSDYKKRREIGLEIIIDADYKITKTTFIKEYQRRLDATEEFSNTDDNALYNDAIRIEEQLNENGIKFSYLKKETSRQTRKLEESNSIPFANNLQRYIRQIRIDYFGNNITLFSTSNNTFLEGRTAFIDNNVQKIQSMFDDVEPETLVHMYIILDSKRYIGIEDYICSFYKERLQHILFTSTHNYCSEIVFEYQYLEEVVTNTWKIFKSYFIKKKSNT